MTFASRLACTSAALALLASCGADLFHGTDWESRCDGDPIADGCPDGAGEGGGASSGTTGHGATTSGTGSTSATTSGTGITTATSGAGGEQPFCEEEDDCATLADDDCDGLFNDGCPPLGYSFDALTLDGFHDEAHNLAASGDAADPSNFAAFALGQLVDGKYGLDDIVANQGSGDGHEWVLWAQPTVAITLDFGVPRSVTSITIGLNNGGFYVLQPSAVEVSFGADGQVFGQPQSFTLKAGTMDAVPVGKRGDVTLPASGLGRFVRVVLVQDQDGGAEGIDEIVIP